MKVKTIYTLGVALLLTGTLIGKSAMAQKINTLTAKEKKEGYKLLFDGKTTTGWKGANMDKFPDNPKGWIVKDGLLTIQGSDGKESAFVGDIVTTEEFSAFDMSFDFRLTPGANSGVKYFVTLAEKTSGSAIGLEYQVLDDDLHPDAKLGRNGNRTMSSLYDLITSTKTKEITHPIGEWNTGRVVAYPDGKVEHYLNGTKVVSYDRHSKEFRDLVAISKYKNWKEFGEAPKGHILIQDHGNTVSYRNFKIKELK
ncbi:3-keto-disaccharide hydrolase [Mucilaginibacter myungsuensis]|uniref:DUF1080 domain-containing protein n=1 Tax=Mucilaginibacter myungsuensis TaxID=649104 RepID=A0A929PXR8_9SPHI|nr:DUF1080 domain-containing protein [Mucilaginibacter myungsuensis]MBE9662557.1 DUF1080 domain-containing protein [Mucilaginibacter myungsuensis]MDN3597977.1 DUF1080 domain-containing protein [Mucilaginibacter myungsuensis]